MSTLHLSTYKVQTGTFTASGGRVMPARIMKVSFVRSFVFVFIIAPLCHVKQSYGSGARVFLMIVVIRSLRLTETVC